MNDTSRQNPFASETLRPIARDTSDFPSLRRDGCIYVDKTAFFHRLAAGAGTKCYFLSRPRRFGKSLMITTLRAIFEGRRDLFDGLAIADTDWPWEPHPVIKFNFAGVSTLTLEAFDKSFPVHVEDSLRDVGFTYDRSVPAGENFGHAIETLGADYKAGKAGARGVVVLIDEYDAPVAHALGDIAKAEAIRERLSEFYIQMKDRTEFLRFVMITGVSKFSKLSVFSALSNIVDISMEDPAYATILGYTEDELTANFGPHLREHARRMGLPYEDYRAEMKRWYNGFRFAKFDDTTLYNPVSVSETLALKNPAFGPKWSSTGRASMLMNYLKREDVLKKDYECVENVEASEFDVADLRSLKPVGMLFQAGYITVRDYDPDSDLFTLGVPDEEVRRDLAKLVVGVSADEDMAWAGSLGAKLIGADWNAFFVGLKSLYAHLPYGSTEGAVQEFSYQRVLCTLLASQGVQVVAEDRQSDGRADIVSKHKKGIYIFELKVDEPVDAAFAQIRARGYGEPYLADGRPIWAIGLSFDRATRRLVGTAVERLA